MGTPSTTKSTYFPSQADSDVMALKGSAVLGSGNVFYVDETNGADANSGLDGWADAKATIQAAITAASQGDTILIAPVEVSAGDTDPGSYSENLVIAPAQAYLTLMGVPRGRTQGGLPQLKVGATTTAALLTIRAPGVTIRNLGVNGAGGTGGGILLDEVTSTGQAWGTTIENCHFKNCVGTTSTLATTGAAIHLKGAPWQVLIKGNRFYKNVGDILVSPTNNDLQDLVIEDNIFSSQAADVDCNIHAIAGGGGHLGVIVRRNVFSQLPSKGATARYMVMTGCTGMLVDCTFGCQTSNTGGGQLTFKSDGTAALIPTTMHVANCFGQSITQAESGEITIAAA